MLDDGVDEDELAEDEEELEVLTDEAAAVDAPFDEFEDDGGPSGGSPASPAPDSAAETSLLRLLIAVGTVDQSRYAALSNINIFNTVAATVAATVA